MAGFLPDLFQNVANGLNSIGIATPELGLTEKLGGADVKPQTANNLGGAAGAGITDWTNGGLGSIPYGTANPDAQAGLNLSGLLDNTQNTAATGGSTGYSAADLAFLDDQTQQLRDLLGRTDTSLNQGLTKNADEYARQLGESNRSKDQQYANFADQRIAQNTGKENAYSRINQNAGNGYRSLAQIIGRSAGTGSSAFRDLLPQVVGTDTSSKRRDATNTYGQNLAGIDKSQGQYDISFQGVLDDLMRQKKANEESLRTGIETQRQGINSQLGTVADQRAQALGGGYAQVKAAQQPFQDSINNSKNQVENFFSQFRTPYVAQQAVAATPDLANYTVDRSNVNAQAQGGGDPTNPYSSILRKKLQGNA